MRCLVYAASTDLPTHNRDSVIPHKPRSPSLGSRMSAKWTRQARLPTNSPGHRVTSLGPVWLPPQTLTLDMVSQVWVVVPLLLETTSDPTSSPEKVSGRPLETAQKDVSPQKWAPEYASSTISGSAFVSPSTSSSGRRIFQEESCCVDRGLP